MNNNKLKLLELFGGIGACSSALTRLGINYEIADYVEIDKYAVASYNAIHNTNFEPQDITTWDKDIKVDLIMHGSPCVTADSLILTKDGYKPITDVQVGDEVLTKSNVWQKVAKKFDNGVHQTCYLDGMGFENIHCTLNHKFYVREMYRKGHKSIRYFKEPVFKMAKDLTKKDYFGVPVIQDEKPFYTNECDFWYMLGMYLGDGWLSKTTNDIIIAFNDTKLEKLKARLNQEKWKYTYYKERTCYKFRFSNKKIYEFIEKYIGTGSNKKNIPYEILCLPKLQLQNFYDGYLDSDGCIVNERHQFSSINRNLIYSISLIINKLYKRPTSIYKNKVKNTKEIEGRLVNQKDWYLLRFNPNKKMQDKAFYEDGYVWYPFNKLVMAEKENVYNMEVEEDHSYIVQGCISKNCQDFSLAGKQAGGDKDSGTRSSLMYETLRIVEKLKPKYVIWENVKNLISKNHIHNFESYLKSMKELGYKNYYKVLNAKDYGIPQNRERIFTISKLDDEPFEFPSKQELKLKLKDMLEDKVDEKYYLSQKMIDCFMSDGTGSYPRRERFEQSLNKVQKENIANTITSKAGTRPVDNYVFTKDTENYVEWKEKGKLDVDCRAFKEDKVSGTIMSSPKNKVLLKEKLCDKLIEENLIEENDVIRRSYSNDRMNHPEHKMNNLSPTLDTMQGGNRQPFIKSKCKRLESLVKKTDFEEGKVLNMDLYNQTTNENISQCLTEPHHNSQRLFDGYRIRKLTPKECWRLMGFDDEAFEKASKVNSNTQLYKQAGNSIVVNVLEAILTNLLIEKEKEINEGLDGQ